MRLKHITEWSERWAIPFLCLAPGKKPDDNPDYQNDQEYSRPDSGLEYISDHLTATQDHSRKKQKHEKVRRVFHRYPPLRLVRSLSYSSKGWMPNNRVSGLSFSLPFTRTIQRF
jgi:hypothetical protein